MTPPPPLTLSFWLNPLPPPFVPLIDLLILVGVLACVIVGIFAHVLRARRRLDRLTSTAIGKAGNTLLVAGCLGLFLYGLAYERVAYLSMRLFWLPLAAWVGWRIWKHWKTITIEIPQIKHVKAEREQFEKWLPKRKK